MFTKMVFELNEAIAVLFESLKPKRLFRSKKASMIIENKEE